MPRKTSRFVGCSESLTLVAADAIDTDWMQTLRRLYVDTVTPTSLQDALQPITDHDHRYKPMCEGVLKVVEKKRLQWQKQPPNIELKPGVSFTIEHQLCIYAFTLDNIEGFALYQELSQAHFTEERTTSFGQAHLQAFMPFEKLLLEGVSCIKPTTGTFYRGVAWKFDSVGQRFSWYEIKSASLEPDAAGQFLEGEDGTIWNIQGSFPVIDKLSHYPMEREALVTPLSVFEYKSSHGDHIVIERVMDGMCVLAGKKLCKQRELAENKPRCAPQPHEARTRSPSREPCANPMTSHRECALENFSLGKDTVRLKREEQRSLLEELEKAYAKDKNDSPETAREKKMALDKAKHECVKEMNALGLREISAVSQADVARANRQTTLKEQMVHNQQAQMRLSQQSAKLDIEKNRMHEELLKSCKDTQYEAAKSLGKFAYEMARYAEKNETNWPSMSTVQGGFGVRILELIESGPEENLKGILGNENSLSCIPHRVVKEAFLHSLPMRQFCQTPKTEYSQTLQGPLGNGQWVIYRVEWYYVRCFLSNEYCLGGFAGLVYGVVFSAGQQPTSVNINGHMRNEDHFARHEMQVARSLWREFRYEIKMLVLMDAGYPEASARILNHRFELEPEVSSCPLRPMILSTQQSAYVPQSPGYSARSLHAPVQVVAPYEPEVSQCPVVPMSASTPKPAFVPPSPSSSSRSACAMPDAVAQYSAPPEQYSYSAPPAQYAPRGPPRGPAAPHMPYVAPYASAPSRSSSAMTSR